MSFERRVAAVESAVYGRTGTSGAALAAALADIASDSGEAARLCASEPDAAAVRARFTRLAGAIANWFVDPSLELSREDFLRLSPRLPDIAHVFYLSGFRTADHVLSALEARSPSADGTRFASKSDARKYVLSSSVFSKKLAGFLRLVDVDPQALHAEFLRMFLAGVTAEPHAHENRHAMLRHASRLATVRLKADSLGALHHVWALSSYGTAPDKHDAKAHLNAAVRALLEAHGVEKAARAVPLGQPPAAEDSPHLVVACEVFGEGHVMFRCFAHQLRQLRRRFRVTCVVAREDLQGEKPDWCDALEVFPTDPLDPADLARRIAALRPDVILYPCIGMRLWAVLLSNLRLAPVQVAALGHPATTRSPCIDAMIVGSDLLGSAECFSERVVSTESPGSVYDLSYANDVGHIEVRDCPDVLRVAACGNLLKFNAEFVLTVRDIVTRVRRPIELHFFPNATGVRHRVVREQLEGLISVARVVVHARKPNIEYLHTLKSCDAYLSPFPFGGENSTLDAVLAGLPVLTLRGPEPHSRLDSRVLRLAGAPEWLTTDSRQDYVERAARLLTDDALRLEAARAIIQADLPARVEAERRRYERDFVEAVWSAYTTGRAGDVAAH